MPVITSSSIQEIKRVVPIEDVVGSYVELKRTGSSLRGLSPFTNEKTASFYVYPEKGFYYCFSSSQGGDVISFIQKLENMTFVDAIEHLAQRFNITLEYESGDQPTPGEGPSERKLLLDLHETATAFYEKAFHAQTEEGKAIREYWANRGFSLEDARAWNIGLSPTGKFDLLESVRRSKKYPDEILEQSGLFYVNEKSRPGQRLAGSRFRGRLMIPIRDIQGRVIAFTARQTPLTPADDPSREAKYVNSPETPLFHKGDILFGLDVARTEVKAKGAAFLLVEGQLDALRCRKEGLGFAVAPQGTGLTENQMALLRRYAGQVIACFDGDAAGRKAAWRAFSLALKTGLEIRCVELPGGQDPDSVLRDGGAQALNQFLGDALPGIDFIIRQRLPEKTDVTPETRREVLEELFEAFLGIPSQVVLQSYLERAAKLLGMPVSPIEGDFETYRRRHSFRGTDQSSERDTGPLVQNKPLTNPEEELFLILLSHSDLIEPTASVINCEWISPSSLSGRLLRRLLADIQNGILVPSEVSPEVFEDEEHTNMLYRLLAREISIEEPLRRANECLKRIYVKYIRAQQNEVLQRLQQADPTDADFAHKLSSELKELSLSLRHHPEISTDLSHD